MDVSTFAEIVERMVLEHDYPGFEARSLRLGLPIRVLKAPAKLFGQALSHKNVHVKLAALRWFQERAGTAKVYTNVIVDLLQDPDEWVKLEAIRLLERISEPTRDVVLYILPLLKDPYPTIRKSAAKALGKIVREKDPDREAVILALKNLASDHDSAVRFKAQKSLRQLGHYSI